MIVRGLGWSRICETPNDEDDHADHPRQGRSMSFRSWGLSSVAGKFSNRLLGAVIVDQRLAGRGGGDQCGDGSVVECARQTQAGLVESRNRVVRNQLIVATGLRQMVLQVLG